MTSTTTDTAPKPRKNSWLFVLFTLMLIGRFVVERVVVHAACVTDGELPEYVLRDAG